MTLHDQLRGLGNCLKAGLSACGTDLAKRIGTTAASVDKAGRQVGLLGWICQAEQQGLVSDNTELELGPFVAKGPPGFDHNLWANAGGVPHGDGDRMAGLFLQTVCHG
jgi:hypothetical protein